MYNVEKSNVMGSVGSWCERRMEALSFVICDFRLSELDMIQLLVVERPCALRESIHSLSTSGLMTLKTLVRKEDIGLSEE